LRRAYYEALVSPREKPVKLTAESTDIEWETARKAQVGMIGTFLVVEDAYDTNGDYVSTKTIACLHMEVPQARETLQTFAASGEYVQKAAKRKEGT
jgi:hypothetical protein